MQGEKKSISYFRMPFTCSQLILYSICFHLPLSFKSFLFVEYTDHT